MLHEDNGTVWASVLAVLSVTAGVGALYLPLFLK